LARVLTFGAKKYAAHNWRKGIVYSRLFDALQRHLWAWWSGEEIDPESGESHLDHAACCLMFLRELSLRPELDDRYKTVPEKLQGHPRDVWPESPIRHPSEYGGLPPVQNLVDEG
jgi:hypothetical protein